MAPVPTSADAAGSAAATMSRKQRSAAIHAAAAGKPMSAAQAARPVIVPESEVNPGIALSPGVASLKPDDVVAAFLGQPVVTAGEGDDKGATTDEDATKSAEEGEETGQEAETETETKTEEGDESDAVETETETETETASPLGGIEKVLKDKGVPASIIKRTLEVFQEKAELAEKTRQLAGKPPVVLSPSATDPLSHAATEADVDAAVTSAKTDARSKLRWLNRHLDGGVWAAGTEAEREFNAQEVDKLIEHYESIADNVERIGESRKAHLKSYAEVVARLEIPAAEIIEPKMAHRESKFLRDVPEVMKRADYLEILADAKAWREVREKKAKGIQFVEIDPKKSKPAADAGNGAVKPKPNGSSNTRPAVPAPSAEQAMTLEQLRERASKGSQRAQEEITRRFMASV